MKRTHTTSAAPGAPSEIRIYHVDRRFVGNRTARELVLDLVKAHRL